MAAEAGSHGEIRWMGICFQKYSPAVVDACDRLLKARTDALSTVTICSRTRICLYSVSLGAAAHEWDQGPGNGNEISRRQIMI